MEQLLQFDRMAKLRDITTAYAQLGDDYIISRITPESAGLELFTSPVRFSALTLCLVREGEIRMEYNLKEITAGENTILALGPSSIVKPMSISADKIDACVAIFSSSFLEDLNFDANAFDIRTMLSHSSPTLQLNDDEVQMLLRYFSLLRHNAEANTDPVLAKNIGRSLVQAMVYQILQFRNNHSADNIDADSSRGRRVSYVHDFLSLVRVHHSRQRNIAFYASKLCISPKYLSHIIKEATGKSAAEWIDQLVILEAKSLLRFSNKNVQQVAYALNFPTQSAFGKYFKHLTGMSPTQYQKT